MIAKSDIKTWTMLCRIALHGSTIFLENIISPEKLQKNYSNYTFKNARIFFLLNSLAEVQKAGIAMTRWIKFAESELKNELSKPWDTFHQLTLESLIDEQSVWQRKLAEVLVTLICFSTTNKVKYYYHYLSIADLQRYEAVIQEQRDFFSGASSTTENAVAQLRRKIETTEGGIDNLGKCWYLKNKQSIQNHRRGPLLSSFRQRFIEALSISSLREKTALVYTYGKGFSEASRNIHFSPGKPDVNDAVGRFSFGITQSGLLAIYIINRAHSLLKIKPKGLNQQIQKLKDSDVYGKSPTTGKARVGDFVLTRGIYLGEVLATDKSAFGYESYLVKYLDKTPVNDIFEDWLTAFDVQLFMRKKEIAKRTREELAAFEAETREELPTFSDSEIDAAVRNSVREIWRRGVREWLKRQVAIKRKKLHPKGK